MEKYRFEDHFTINKNSSVPAYQQVTEAVLEAIKTEMLSVDDKLPSINILSELNHVSRATVEKSYADLCELGILGAHHGKGFFISSKVPAPEIRILLLFNQLNSYNRLIYESLVNHLGTNVTIDFDIYHNSAAHLGYILKKRSANYSFYLIIPNFQDDADHGYNLINRLPKSKLILLDKNIRGISGDFGTVYENFASDIYQALVQLFQQLRKYHTICLIYEESGYFPEDIVQGFVKFCESYNVNYKVRYDLRSGNVREGEAYIVVSDDRMMALLKEIHDRELVIGKEVGIISYNDNDAKKVMQNGLTTISTDFFKMGKLAADMIRTGSMTKIENTFNIHLRSSV
jgi:DNA-binding transcriptional regulator YhcF (GntR family)